MPRRRSLQPLERLESRLLFATFQVTTSADSGPGSLRQAMLDANAAPGPDAIVVDAALRGQAISPLSELPALTGPVQMGEFSIDGAAAGPGARGLMIERGGAMSQLGALFIAHFGGSGLVVSAPDVSLDGNATIQSNGHNPAASDPADTAGIRLRSGALRFRMNVFLSATQNRVNVWDNGGDGIRVEPNVSVEMENCNIGTDQAGTADHGNGGDGIRVTGGARVIASDSNVGYNDGAGIAADGAGAVLGLEHVGSFYNGSHGVAATGGATVTFTGQRYLASPPADPLSTYKVNVIHHNGGSGLYVEGPADAAARPASSATVNAADIVQNTGDGITIVNADGVQLGGGGVWTCIVSGNGGNGVTVRGQSQRNDTSDADIAGNAGLAIDLGGDGPTPNDAGDADAGPNTLQNTPVLTSATMTGNRVTVTGTLNTTPNTTVFVRFYTDNPTPGGTPSPDGGLFVNQTTVTTDNAGNASFSVPLERIEASFPGHGFPGLQGRAYPIVGATVRATATVANNTSEFSRGVGVLGSVLGVYADGTHWTQPFRNAMAYEGVGTEIRGYRLATYAVDGSETRRPAPVWTGLDEITMVFDRGSRLQQDNLTVTGLHGPYNVVAFSENPTDGSATWRLDRPIEFDRVTLSLARVPGYDFTFTVTPGDVDRSGRVNAIDLSAVRSKLNSAADDAGHPTGGYTTAADVNGSGRINALDLSTVRRSIQVQPTPWPPATLTASATSITAGFFGEQRIL